MYFFLMVYVVLITCMLKRNISIKINANRTITIKNIFLFLLISIPLIYISAFRDFSIGTDTNGVYRFIYYEGYGVHNWQATLYEGLYIYFVKFIHWVRADYRFLLLITSIIISTFYIGFFIKRKEYINITIAILGYLAVIYTFSMNGQRQILAGAICLITIELLERKKTVLAILSVIIACFFHITAIVVCVYFVPYFLRKTDFWKKRIVIIFCFAPVALLFAISILSKLPFMSKFMKYVTAFDFNSLNTKSFLLPLLLSPFIILYGNKLLKKREDNYLHLCGYIFIFTAVLFSGFLWYAFRLMYFFVPSEILIMSQLGDCAEKRIEKYAVNIYVVLAVVITFLVVYVFHDTDLVYPYKLY